MVDGCWQPNENSRWLRLSSEQLFNLFANETPINPLQAYAGYPDLKSVVHNSSSGIGSRFYLTNNYKLFINCPWNLVSFAVLDPGIGIVDTVCLNYLISYTCF